MVCGCCIGIVCGCCVMGMLLGGVLLGVFHHEGRLSNSLLRSSLSFRGSFCHMSRRGWIGLERLFFGIVCPYCWFSCNFVGVDPGCRTQSMFPLFWGDCFVVVNWVQCCGLL